MRTPNERIIEIIGMYYAGYSAAVFMQMSTGRILELCIYWGENPMRAGKVSIAFRISEDDHYGRELTIQEAEQILGLINQYGEDRYKADEELQNLKTIKLYGVLLAESVNDSRLRKASEAISKLPEKEVPAVFLFMISAKLRKDIDARKQDRRD